MCRWGTSAESAGSCTNLDHPAAIRWMYRPTGVSWARATSSRQQEAFVIATQPQATLGEISSVCLGAVAWVTSEVAG
jgi:hypothetical protein